MDPLLWLSFTDSMADGQHTIHNPIVMNNNKHHTCDIPVSCLQKSLSMGFS